MKILSKDSDSLRREINRTKQEKIDIDIDIAKLRKHLRKRTDIWSYIAIVSGVIAVVGSVTACFI